MGVMLSADTGAVAPLQGSGSSVFPSLQEGERGGEPHGSDLEQRTHSQTSPACLSEAIKKMTCLPFSHWKQPARGSGQTGHLRLRLHPLGQAGAFSACITVHAIQSGQSSISRPPSWQTPSQRVLQATTQDILYAG